MVQMYVYVRIVASYRFITIPAVTVAAQCVAVPKEMWMDARREDVLDAPYFHLVFTVPDILNPVIYSNQRLLYDALYHAASSTISELTADPKHLGAKVGYICILHTWGSEMNFHPHIHTILLGEDWLPTTSGRTMVKISFFPSGSSPKCSAENIWRN